MELWKRCIVRDQQVVFHCEFNLTTHLHCPGQDDCPSLPHFSTTKLKAQEPLSVSAHVLTDLNTSPTVQ